MRLLLVLLLATAAFAVDDDFERSSLNPGTGYAACGSGVCWTNDASTMRITTGHDAEQSNLLQIAATHWNANSPGASTYPTSARTIFGTVSADEYCGPLVIDATAKDEVACVANGVNVKLVAIDNNVLTVIYTITQAVATTDQLLLEVSAADKFGCYVHTGVGPDVLQGSIQTIANISTGVQWGMGCFPASSL